MSRILTAARLLTYCIDLANRNRTALGFIPRARFADRIDLGQVHPHFENDDLCGYILVGRSRDWLHVHQVCIQDDARRLEHGRSLVALAQGIARRGGCQGLSLRCATDLPSNAFWAALGFERVATVAGGLSRGRLINVYKLPFDDAFPLIESASPSPGPHSQSNALE
jgi:GNAT superfamily N-acetyltransferase